MTTSVNSIGHNTRRIAATMNDKAVQAIVARYIESLKRRHRGDDQRDTELERKRQ